jgi:hypothetical protein
MNNEIVEVSASRLRKMLVSINLDKRKKRAERIEVFNTLNDKFNQWVDEHKEVAFHVSRDSKSNTGVEVEVVRLDDSQWLYGFSVQLSDRGCGSGMNCHDDLYPSREEAVKAGVVRVTQYLLGESIRSDVNEGLGSQIKKFLKASMEVILGQKEKQSTLF